MKRGVGGFEKGGIDTTRWMKRALEEYRVFLLDQVLVNPLLVRYWFGVVRLYPVMVWY